MTSIATHNTLNNNNNTIVVDERVLKERERLLNLTREFIVELDGNYDYNKACDYLTEDFCFKTPFAHFKSRAEYREKFPKLHKDKPNFDDVMWDNTKKNHNTVIRYGKKKHGPLTIKMYEIIHFNVDGTKIKSIEARKV